MIAFSKAKTETTMGGNDEYKQTICFAIYENR
jgi:hypothetical protein